MKLIGSISDKLTPPHRIAVLASLEPKIKTLTSSELSMPLISILTEAYETIGQKMDESITSTSKLLKIELMNYFTTYSLEEVRVAVRMGVTGKLCDLSTLPIPVVSVHNVCKFIHLYNEKVRKDAVYEQRKHEEANNKELEERKKVEGNARLDAEINVCLEAYNEDKRSLDIVSEDLKACYFRRLREVNGKGLIDLEIMNQILIISESNHKTFEELSKQEQHAISKIREVEKFKIERISAVKVTAQAIALRYWFDKLAMWQ